LESLSFVSEERAVSQLSTGIGDSEDFLHGAEKVAKHLQSRGVQISTAGVYYAARTNLLPLGRLGRTIIASRAMLDSHLEKIAAGN
jgi:hypothetical protein